MAEFADYIDVDLFDFSGLNATMEWKMVLDEDGALTMSLDGQKMADSLRDVMGTTKEKLVAAIPDILEAAFAQQGMTMDEVETALAAQGMSLDEMVDEMARELESSFDAELQNELDSMELSVEESGYYVVNGNKIYVLDEKDNKPSEDSYLEFELNGDELTITDMPDEVKEVFSELEEMSGGSLLPLTFTRTAE